MNNEQEIKQLKKDIVKGHAKNKYKNQGVQFTADQVVASLQEEQKAALQDGNKARIYAAKKKQNKLDRLEAKIIKAIDFEKNFINKYYIKLKKDNLDNYMVNLKIFVEESFENHRKENNEQREAININYSCSCNYVWLPMDKRRKEKK